MTEAPATSRRLVALPMLLSLFVLSGAAGLIYQSVWSQYLGLILGHAAYAQSLVLAIFMGGMSIGAWASSRWVERLGNPLFAYGIVEGAIGLFGLGFHALFVWSTESLYGTLIPGTESPFVIDAMRWTLAAALILPQTILLGATFPIMSVGLARWYPETSGRVLGGLYFFNSIGAAAGALLATFWLVPVSGLPGTMLTAGIANLVITLCLVGARLPARPALTASGAGGAGTRDAFYRFVLFAALATGASSFMYEIGWVRMLSLALGASVHAFELMLAAFIGGLAFGGLWTRKRLDGHPDPVGLLARVQVMMGLCALATLPIYDHAFRWMGWLLGSIARTDSGYTLFNVASAAIAVAIMAPAAFFAGMTLPIMTYVLLKRGAGERAIGHVYAANTLGAIIGVLLATHVAIPLAGLKVSMVTAALIDVVLGFAIVLVGGGARRPARLALYAGGIAALSVALVVAAPFDPRRMASGVYRTGLARLGDANQIRFYRDGKTATVALYGDETGLTIATNGKPDAALSIGDAAPTGDEPTMILLGMIGQMFHVEAKTVAVIGFGSGLTTHTLASHSQFERIDTVEIEPQMVEAARGFGARVERAFTDPRSRILIDDARAYFSSGRSRYDLIVSEPSNPWVSGVAKLFSTEFYRFARAHLAEGGLLVQWVQGYELDSLTFLTILRALDGEFADYRLYLASGADVLIVATPEGRLGPPRVAALSEPKVRELADIAGIHAPADLEERFLADRDLVRALIATSGANPNSDFFPIVAHAAPRDRFIGAGANRILGLPKSTLGAYTLLGLVRPQADGVERAPPVFNPLVDSRRQAWVLHDAMLDLPYTPQRSDEDVLRIASVLRLHALTCFARLPDIVAARTLISAFAITAAALPLDRTRELWATRAWAPCTVVPGPETAAMLDVLAATMSPDAAVSYAAATRALDTLPLESLARPTYVQLAAIAAIRGRDQGALDAALQRLANAPLDEAQRFELFTLANYGRELIRATSAGNVPPR